MENVEKRDSGELRVLPVTDELTLMGLITVWANVWLAAERSVVARNKRKASGIIVISLFLSLEEEFKLRKQLVADG